MYFDDFKIEHIKGPVTQSEDYYPFRLTFNSYRRENSLTNRWKFQGQEHVMDLGLNWDSFKWRNHQPDIGRFFNVDPLSDKYVYNSPYAFAENKLGLGRELEGLELAPFNPQTTHSWTPMAEAFRQAFDGMLSMFKVEAKVYSKVSATVGEGTTGNAKTSTSTTTETKAFFSVDGSKIMDINSSNNPDISSIVDGGVKSTTTQVTETSVSGPTPVGLPVNLTVSSTINPSNQSRSTEVEVSAGIKKGNVQANVYVNTGSFSFKKGFSVKAEIEKLNALVPSSPFASDGSRQWVWSAFVGIKKDYKFIGKVRGNVQVLYNLYDDHDNSPYVDRFSVRTGFEWGTKKKKSK